MLPLPHNVIFNKSIMLSLLHPRFLFCRLWPLCIHVFCFAAFGPFASTFSVVCGKFHFPGFGLHANGVYSYILETLSALIRCAPNGERGAQGALTNVPASVHWRGAGRTGRRRARDVWVWDLEERLPSTRARRNGSHHTVHATPVLRWQAPDVHPPRRHTRRQANLARQAHMMRYATNGEQGAQSALTNMLAPAH